VFDSPQNLGLNDSVTSDVVMLPYGGSVIL